MVSLVSSQVSVTPSGMISKVGCKTLYLSAERLRYVGQVMADGVVMPPEEDLCRARLVPLRYLSQQLRRTVADYLDPTVGMRQCYKQLAQYLLDYNDVRITGVDARQRESSNTLYILRQCDMGCTVGELRWAVTRMNRSDVVRFLDESTPAILSDYEVFRGQKKVFVTYAESDCQQVLEVARFLSYEKCGSIMLDCCLIPARAVETNPKEWVKTCLRKANYIVACASKNYSAYLTRHKRSDPATPPALHTSFINREIGQGLHVPSSRVIVLRMDDDVPDCALDGLLTFRWPEQKADLVTLLRT